MKSFLLIICVIVLTTISQFGQCPVSFTSDADGDYATAANWTGDIAPPNPIPPGVTVTINNVMTNSGIIENNGTITVIAPGSFTNLSGAIFRGKGTFNGNFINSGTVAPGSTVVLPTLFTTAISSIAGTTATSGGTICYDGGEALAARGVCWSTTPNPTVALTTKTIDAGNPFVSNITGLNERTTYYIRAYATNSAGTSYGNELSFTTNCGPVTFTYNGASVTYGTVLSEGRCWLDRNLGASQVATSSTDAAAYGDLFQWGRLADGHQLKTSGTTGTLSGNDDPGHDDFILNGSSPWDWRSPQNSNLWQGLYGVNNPCPSGFRVPTEAEFQIARSNWSSDDAAGAFASPLKLPMAGYRIDFNGLPNEAGNRGVYWFSNIDGTYARELLFLSNAVYIFSDHIAYGNSVRCIKDDGPTGNIASLDCGSATVTGTLTEGVAASGASASIPYTGGNGGSHAGQSVASTGVTGLTAYLYPGVFNNGPGNLIYSISGTPVGNGTATFALNIGGQSCNLNVTVVPGSISGLNCAGATITGTLTEGVAASGVSASVPYTGGNGGSHSGQTVSSTGVTGLSANTPAGNFANGNGNLIYTISGTPLGSGTATFALNIGGQSCNLSVPVACNPSFITQVVEVTSAGGKIWMDRNLGAHQAATSSTDNTAYGYLYQWGRLSDGHQCRTSGTTTTLSGNDVPGHGNFIINGTDPYDWRNPQNNDLWQGVSGTNNPCPNGYRLPTQAEWNTELQSWTAGAFASPLKLPLAGHRQFSNGTITDAGSVGYYWSSTGSYSESWAESWYLVFNNVVAFTDNYVRALGMSVRCIKDYPGIIGSLNCTGATITGTLTEGVAASGVSASVPYTGGNGGSHSGQTVSSTGVTGLSANTPAGNFANGNGNLIYTISGTPLGSGTATFALNIGGQSCNLSVPVACNPSFITQVVEVTSAGGKIWMDRNLGAHRAATSSDDIAALGYLYQWGRLSDGHQCRISGTVSTQSTTDVPGHDDFICDYGDWRNPKNDNLWQGINGINNPCPTGYRIPTKTEWEAEIASWSPSTGVGAFNSPLKIPYPGRRSTFCPGAIDGAGTGGMYWSSTVGSAPDADKAFRMSIDLASAFMHVHGRAVGAAVRCIKDYPGIIGSLNCTGATITGTLTEGVAATGVSASVPYTGGNGGSHSGQTVSSTGVTGLSANTPAGNFVNGNGSLTYTITGTPLCSGTATFALNIGGQSCNLNVTVVPGSISGLNCAGATITGTLTEGVAATGVSASVPYTGGNGGSHSGQTVGSTGVTGLTATTPAGNFANGNGSLTYTITGTPVGNGTATFALNIGGQSCNLNVTVVPGSISGLNCTGATITGTLTEGVAATGVSASVPYTGGNGGSHSGQTVGSTGVTGLTATTPAGNFANGNGNLIYTITGTPLGAGIATFALNIGGRSCNLNINVACNPGFVTQVVEVTSAGGKIWMDRNLGAHQAATSSNHAPAYGYLYQWGRLSDGHQCRASESTSTLSVSDSPGHDDFIMAPAYPYDWRQGPNNNLWQGASGINNPCPSGFRVPTYAEWDAERLSWAPNNNVAGAFASPLKLPVAGYRSLGDGSLLDVGNGGYYWSSTVSSINSFHLVITSNDGFMHSNVRAWGLSVRCIKEPCTAPAPPTAGTHVPSQTQIVWNWNAVAGATGYKYNTANNYATATDNGTSTTYTQTGLTCNTPYTLYVWAYNTCGNSTELTLNSTTTECPFVCGTSTVTFTYKGNSVTYGTVTSANSRCWLDRNLGASRVAISSDDADAYGDLFQWGRLSDTHQNRTSGTTTTLSTTDNPLHGNFIINGTNPYDWRNPQNNGLWQGVSGTNNPCPNGYRLPAEAEWNTEWQSWAAGAFASPLKLPMAGYRNNFVGSVYDEGSFGSYWSSTVTGIFSWYLYFYSNDAGMSDGNRGYGMSVRCLKD